MKPGNSASPIEAIPLLLAFSTVVWGQTGTSSVRGTIADQQNSMIAGASVNLTNAATSAVRTQRTGPTGTFSFDQLPPGTYRLEAEAPGFKKTVVQSVQALIDHPTDVDIQLSVGGSSEVVTVEAESTSVQVNTQDATLGNNFVSRQITQLPLESRNVLALLTLQPGVTKDGYVAGARSDQSNITLDGVDINDAQSNSVAPQANPLLGQVQNGGPVLRLNAEAVDQFRVSTVGQSATASRASGAQIALVTKSGTNQFHGVLFELNRNTISTANDWFNNHNNQPRPALIRNTFGGTFGGPIKRDKIFFFYSYEGRRDASQTGVPARLVPLPDLGQGIVKFHDSTGAPRQLIAADIATIFPDTGGVNPLAQSALAAAAAKYQANSTQVGDGLNTSGFVFNAPQPVKLNSHVAKFDYNLTEKQLFFARLNVIYDHDQSIFTPQFPDTSTPMGWSHPWGLALSHTWTLRDTLVNSFRYGLTRQSFTTTGDQTANFTQFRLVFVPIVGRTASSRLTPVHNLVDDVTWAKQKHTIQFGANVTLVSNRIESFVSSFDTATTNPSGYKTRLIINAVNQYLNDTVTPGLTIAGADESSLENAITALLGRYTQYTANFNFSHSGTPLAAGHPTSRDFKTQGYEGYIQDVWKVRPSIVLTAGLRYSLWRPVYEANGFEVQPQIPLGEIFKRRVAAMNAGQNYTQDIVINLSGPANGGKPMYGWNKTNFLPRAAVAWSPRFSENSFWSKLLGKSGQSVLRSGFSMLDDYFGEQLATFFDTRNTLGFSSSTVIPVNTYNVGCGHYVVTGNNLATCTPVLGPLFTSFTQEVRSLPNITPPGNLTFPQQKSEQTYPTRIETSLDSMLTTPKNYAMNLTYEREMLKGGLLQVSYIGRFGRHLLAQRDIATPIDLKDPKSSQDWYTAATMLEKARQAGVPLSQVGVAGGTIVPQPFFENFFQLATVNSALCPSSNPNCYVSATQAFYDDALANTNDWTTVALDFENLSILGKHAFYQPQYGALNTWTTIGYSNFNALAASYRQRLRHLTVDLNYTYSHSLDNASGLQNGASFSGASLILNPFRPQDNYASSDFDMRHMINVNSIWDLPFGRGQAFASNASGVLDAIIGGWQLSDIVRWNRGLPLGAPYDRAQWSTNWENQSQVNLIAPLPVAGCANRLVTTPKFFGNCLAQAQAAFRSSYPGETGLRNYFRMPGFVDLDMGLSKNWKLPGREGHALQFRWETFNVTNTQEFGFLDFSRNGWGLSAKNGKTAGTLARNFSNFTKPMQGSPRVMQIGLRYSF